MSTPTMPNPLPPLGKEMFIKTISLTDHNNKKYCRCMIHVDRSPADRVTDEVMHSTLFEIRWDDGSTGRYLLDGFHRQPLHTLHSGDTLASHAMINMQFVNWYIKNNPGTTRDTEMAVYIYYKVS